MIRKIMNNDLQKCDLFEPKSKICKKCIHWNDCEYAEYLKVKGFVKIVSICLLLALVIVYFLT